MMDHSSAIVVPLTKILDRHFVVVVLYVIGSLAESLASFHQIPVAPPPLSVYDNPKCLQAHQLFHGGQCPHFYSLETTNLNFDIKSHIKVYFAACFKWHKYFKKN